MTIDQMTRGPICTKLNAIFPKICTKLSAISYENKKQKQLQGAEKGYVVKDGIETGHLNVLPLWQFGLNY